MRCPYQSYLLPTAALEKVYVIVIKHNSKVTGTEQNVGGKSKQQQMKLEDGKIARCMKSYFGKIKGGDLQSGPPPMSSIESLLTFFGSFMTLLILALLSESIKDASSDQYLIILGPFGALVRELSHTLQLVCYLDCPC